VHVLAAAHGLGTGDAAGLALARREYHIALGLWPHRTDAFARRQRAAAIAGLAGCDFQDPTCAEGADAGALLARFRAALAQDDGYVPAWVGIGVAYAREQRFEPALAAFAAALAIDPMCPEAWFNQARAQHAIGWRAEARLSFDRALRCDPRLAAAAAHALASR
jgi:tetratricopeptide (TPR) repeat protein